MQDKLAIDGGTPVRSKDNFFIFGAPNIRQTDIDEVAQVIRSGWLSTGPRTAEFEKKFAEYNNMAFGIGTNSCTAALHLSLMALDLPPGSEVITTDMTFCATVNAILHAGLKPVIADCNALDQNISIDSIYNKIGPNTKAILPVHFAGMACDMEDLRDLANRFGLKIVSDAAHAIETRYKHKSVAAYSDLTAYSFYATKNICVGEGGMVLTDNKEYAENIRTLSLHGMSKNAHLRYGSSGFKHYSIDRLGYKYNMMDITAAMGIRQLERVEYNWSCRKHVWQQYVKGLQDLPITLPFDDYADRKHGYHLFAIRLDLDQLTVDRDRVLDALIAENIGTGVHYNAIHTHPYYTETLGLKAEDFPAAEAISKSTLSLPLSSWFSEQDVYDVIEAVRKVITYYRK